MTITEWESGSQTLDDQVLAYYCFLLLDNNLNPYEYHPVIGWAYENDDFAKNRITIIIEAAKIPVIDEDLFWPIKTQTT